MPKHDEESLTNHLVQVITDTLSDELDVLVSTDNEVYNKVTELAKLCSDKFYAEMHLENRSPCEFEYRNMDEFPSEEE